MNSACIHHSRHKIDYFLTDFIFRIVTYSSSFECKILLCFLDESICWFWYYLFNWYVCLLSRRYFRFIFFNFFLLLGSFLAIFFTSLFSIFSFLLSSFFLLLFLFLQPIKLSFSHKSPDCHRIIPVMELPSCLFKLYSFAEQWKLFIGSNFGWIVYYSDSFGSFGVNMSDSRYKAKVFMDWPLELHNLIRIIFNLEVNSFLLLYYTVSEIDFVLLLDR